jgi:hypothetical protein
LSDPIPLRTLQEVSKCWKIFFFFGPKKVHFCQYDGPF